MKDSIKAALLYLCCVITATSSSYVVTQPYGILITLVTGVFLGVIVFVLINSVPWVNKKIGWNKIIRSLYHRASAEY
ncbi:hypothetical protein [Aliiglaciecola sp. M165]|uniref:hypothetical protein n=1 Tax=Aliiglaciecola sp. M165 TaxID=2593649 RepID=UPI001180E2CA|nr:hypothetical protein [Aliiglaciecola sp. M165]TRY29784.1 hypothetical protein FM019_16570 [Aliiglaciecola sp. M165]